MGFYSVGKRGTVTRQRFNCRGACKRLYEGMKGLGTNEDAITEVVAGHTVAQRQEIKTKYKIMYGKDLVKQLDSELSGAFGKLVLSLMKDPEEYILECIRNAIVKSRGDKLLKKMKKMTYLKGLCGDAKTLLSLLLLRSNQQLNDIKIAYKAKYETELEDDVGLDFADEFRSLIFGIIYAGRDESNQVDMEQLQEDIDTLHHGAEDATREEHFQSCFEERSWSHLRQLYSSYKDVTGESIDDLIEKSDVFSDIMKEAYGAVVKIVRSESDFYAERLKEAIEGIGTDDFTLISIIVLRAEIDLVDIIEKYEDIFGRSLEEDVVGDTSGDYKNILLKLLTIPEEEDDDEDGDERNATQKDCRVKKQPGVEMSTQTEEEEEPHIPVNAADHEGEEAIGHEGVGEEVEEGEQKELVEETETADPLESAIEAVDETETVRPLESALETVEVDENEEAESTVTAENQDTEKQELSHVAIEEVEAKDMEESTCPVEENVEESMEIQSVVAIVVEEAAPLEVEPNEEDEEGSKRKAEEVDNAEGG